MDEANQGGAPEGADDPQTPAGPGVENVSPPADPGEDPAARDAEGDAAAEDAAPLSQDVPAEVVEQTPIQADAAGDPANQEHRDAPAPPEWQSGHPKPDEVEDRAPSQTAGGSTDGLSPGTQADANVEGEGDDGSDD